jgi:uncharacterized damage-inducible protein DinB
MPDREELLREVDEEMAVTRRVLERVPDDRPDWKPHPKSFSIAHLAQLVAWMPGWQVHTLKQDFLDLTKAGKYSNESTATLLETFDQGVAAGRAALAEATAADFTAPWELRMGDRVLFTSTKGRVVRQNISHLVHHRAQLGVYLRLLDVPVPGMYGPTADERGMMG